MTSSSPNPDTPLHPDPKRLEWWQIRQLEKQGCSADDWESVCLSPLTDLDAIRRVKFLSNVIIEEGVRLSDIPGGIGGCTVCRNASIENTASIVFEPDAPCGVGTSVAVLDETGARPVVIYPGLSSQTATLMARVPSWLENNLMASLPEFLETKAVPHVIGEESLIRNCGPLLNVSVGNGVTIEGCQRLADGAVINNAPGPRPLAYVGSGVNAENFIIEDGAVSANAIIRNCYVGQGATVGKGFSAHDSLFFANCKFENGEACALLAGPYSVSMHKSSLLIGIQTSFMNAGSASNQSNHMYKLGPVHWGILERGVKTSSGSYLMLGAKIGAFSLLMGQHKTHPDSSEFPFSYLFGDERGATVVVPGVMLRSCGLLRDETKWPTRDKRTKARLPLADRINFRVLSPFTVDTMLKAIDTIASLLSRPADDDLYLRYKGMKFTRASLSRARELYSDAIMKFLSISLPDGVIPDSDGKDAEGWTDIGGQLMPRHYLEKALTAATPDEAEAVFSEAYGNHDADLKEWISRRFGAKGISAKAIKEGSARFDALVEADRTEYLDNLARENAMLRL